MKKWPIFAAMAALLVLYGVLVGVWLGVPKADPMPTAGSGAQLSAPAPSQESAPPSTTVPAPTDPPQVVYTDPDGTRLTGKHIFVFDATGGRMLYTLGDQNERIYPASLTKLFTAWVALQYLEGRQMVTVGEEISWIAEDSSVTPVFQGSRLSVEQIIQGMLMHSGNDAAYALAVTAGRRLMADDGADPRAALNMFLEEMNRQAQTLGLTGTHFMNPDGYHHDDHYTTARDMLVITQLALTEPLIVRCCATAQVTGSFETGEAYTWKNTNFMLHPEMEEFYCPQTTGLKTGTTSKAGNCLMATFDTGYHQLIIGVFGCQEIEQRFQDALYLFSHYADQME